jgi:glycosyltransferase involved in cell wall biosynthesis
MPADSPGKEKVARPKISVVVTTFNEEKHIAECLESLLWADEILVVDSYSTDHTPEIIRGYPAATLRQRTYFGSAAQKNWAMDQCQHDWILIFDADERCTPELRKEIEELLASGPKFEAYTIRRTVFFLGKRIRFSGWQHDQVIRLLKKGAGRYPNRRVHADMKTRGPAPLLKAQMDHYMVEDFYKYALRLAKYGQWGASQAFREGKRSGPVEVLGRSAWRFFRTYFLQLGIFDGMMGLVFCLLQAYATYLKWSILWSWRVNEKRGVAPDLPPVDENEETWQGLDQLESKTPA